jgi:hypothetical protein
MISQLIAVFVLAGSPGLSMAAPNATLACKATSARYQSTGNAGDRAELRFAKVQAPGFKSDLALGIRSATTKDFHWFLFDRGSARYLNLISTTDISEAHWAAPPPDGGERPLGEMHYIGLDASLAQIDQIPNSEGAAASVIVLPDVQEVFARRGNLLENVDSTTFRLVGC